MPSAPVEGPSTAGMTGNGGKVVNSAASVNNQLRFLSPLRCARNDSGGCATPSRIPLVPAPTRLTVRPDPVLRFSKGEIEGRADSRC